VDVVVEWSMTPLEVEPVRGEKVKRALAMCASGRGQGSVGRESWVRTLDGTHSSVVVVERDETNS